MEQKIYQKEVPDDVLVRENYRTKVNSRWLGSPRKETEELFLTVCGVERCLPEKSYGPTVRKDYHVHFVLHGKGYLQTGGKTYTVQRGQIFATLPGAEVYYYADPTDPWYYTWASFSGTKADYYMEKAGITLEHPIRDSFAEPEEFLSLTEKILDHHQLTIGNELLRTSALYEIVSLLVTSYAGQQKTGHHYDYPQDAYVNTALEYIHHNFSYIQVTDVADYLGISRSYLMRIFKNKLHISPKEYLMNYRLSEASKLLRSTNLTVKEIAKRVGYTNQFSFSESFKSIYGASPKHYREQVFPYPESEKES